MQLVGSLLLGADEFIAQMVQSRIPHMRDSNGFGSCVAIGVVRRGVLLGGAVFHNFRGHDIEMSAAFDRPDWCLPGTMRGLYDYPFNQLGCTRMTTITARGNKHAREIDERMGFKLEGVIRKGISPTEDAFVFGMLKSECRWIKDRSHGKIEPDAARCA
ncbi:GNAT family protein [Bradyrhizobium sp. USDA 3458]|uniref:GNAT family N-acetyltransferase n=1 Tax=Bradyrhizobium sp. USDA 3458 TaxID=2591461 RepID=UPI0011430C09|nr:GNAT family protein [Bradyrhizobium sp. USDA 3458]